MRDGVRLAVDVHLPSKLAVGERVATILHMSRYYRSVDIRRAWRLLLGSAPYPITERDVRERIVKAGYAWVDVDVRGAGASFGFQDYPLSVEEVRDGADLMNWIVAQPWSAGVVGATGSSYDGTLASLLVRNGHPALKAIAPRFSGWDTYGDVFFPGGLQATSLLHAWARLTSALDHDRIADVFGWTGSFISGGVRPVDRSMLPRAIAEHARNVDLLRLLGGVVYRDDSDPRGRPLTMDDVSPHTVGASSLPVPVYACAGMYDGAIPRGQIRQFLANGHPGSRLRLGPWFHAGEFNASPYASENKTTFDHAGELLRFFDYHLRDMDRGFSRDAPVQYYTMGDERWKSSSTWPPQRAVSRSWFLAPEQQLRRDPIHGASTAHPHDRYQVDLSASTGPGSRWGLIVGTGQKRGYVDRRRLSGRLLTYTTGRLDTHVEVTGHPIARLFLATNATDGAVFVYLEDVHPDGAVRYVTEGLLRLIHRQVGVSPIPGDPIPFRSFKRADARRMIPGEVIELVIDLLPTSYVFRTGHSIRLAIAGADSGAFTVPAMASPVAYEVHRDDAHRSRLEVPTYR